MNRIQHLGIGCGNARTSLCPVAQPDSKDIWVYRQDRVRASKRLWRVDPIASLVVGRAIAYQIAIGHLSRGDCRFLAQITIMHHPKMISVRNDHLPIGE
jgi:hypothetical protein